ncbi:MAG TPA: glycosyltransferase, partial [Candidatus Krumholzibacterium sp.]|nr:glycosyltransferase [Candidatus Krumholzibacterium sp.]
MENFDDQRAERLRRLIAIVAAVVTVYYLYWRVTETLNLNAPVLAWSLWGAEVFGAITTFLFYFTVWRPIKREPLKPLEGRTVDVLIPTLNESVTVLRTTLLACNDITYPHRTLVLDDGGREEIRKLAEELGCVYLARDEHKHAKAGNLNYGLEHSEAEFIAVFDADHVPLPHFIERLIGYFEDDKVAFAQAPQEFYNVDSFQHRTDYKKKYIWTEQNLFYSLIQPGRDRWNAAYFVGSSCLMRRKALDEIKGFARESVTEDMLTSIRLHGKGWKSVYHNENLAYGIAAETLLPFHIQRVRWGIGGWQVFFRSNPLFMRGLKLSQRLCYLASLIYPFEGFQKFIFYIVPPITLFTGILPMKALDIQYLLHFVPYYAISMFAFNEMGRGFGGSLMLEQFSMGKFITYMQTLIMFLLPKRFRKFKVTPKGEGRAPVRLMVPQYTVILVSIIAIIWALVQLVFQIRGDEFIIAVNSLWALYNTGLGIAIIQYARQKLLQRRTEFRVPDSVPVLLRPASDAKAEPWLAVANNL